MIADADAITLRRYADAIMLFRHAAAAYACHYCHAIEDAADATFSSAFTLMPLFSPLFRHIIAAFDAADAPRHYDTLASILRAMPLLLRAGERRGYVCR
jgi:hypothetical protein